MKLSKAQTAVLDEANRKIDTARAFETFEEYEAATSRYVQEHGGAEYVRQNAEYYEPYRHFWEEAKDGMPLITANSRTLKALEKSGAIDIIEMGGTFPDRIKVKDY